MENFDLWGAFRDHTDAAKSYDDLLNKVKNHASQRKWDSPAQETMQHDGDPMNIGAIGGRSWCVRAR